MRALTIAFFLGGLIFCASAVAPNSARAEGALNARPIGKVVSATGAVTVEHAGAVVVQANLVAGAAQTKVGNSIYQGDVVQTGADGKVGITFTDGTAFNLSSNARMVLNEFIYDPNSKSNSTLISLTKGTFTFVAGQVAKTGDMKVNTPVATMGIRGTTPHVEISDNGNVAFSTLIEEGKTKGRGKRAAAGNQRQADVGSSSVQPVGRDLNRNLAIEFKICKNC